MIDDGRVAATGEGATPTLVHQDDVKKHQENDTFVAPVIFAIDRRRRSSIIVILFSLLMSKCALPSPASICVIVVVVVGHVVVVVVWLIEFDKSNDLIV